MTTVRLQHQKEKKNYEMKCISAYNSTTERIREHHPLITYKHNTCEEASIASLSFILLRVSIRASFEFPLLELRQPISHILLIQRLVVRVPTTQRRPPLDHIRGAPHNPQLIHLPLRLIVRDQDVELARPDMVQHIQHRLLGAPRARRFLLESIRAGDTGERPTRTKYGTYNVRQHGSMHGTDGTCARSPQ